MDETNQQSEAMQLEQPSVNPPRDRRYPPRPSRSNRSKQISFGLPFEGPRRLRQVSFGLGLPFGDAQDDAQVPDRLSANGESSFLEDPGDDAFTDNDVPDDVDGDGKDSNDHCKENNKWGRGIVADFQRTVLTNWTAEMSNLNQTVIATTFFLFFACIAPAITFGKRCDWVYVLRRSRKML